MGEVSRGGCCCFRVLNSLTGRCKFSLFTPFGSLSGGFRGVVLGNSKARRIRFRCDGSHNSLHIGHRPFRNVLGALSHHCGRARSDSMHSSLSGCVSARSYSDYRKAHLHLRTHDIFINSAALPRVYRVDVRSSVTFFDSLTLGKRGTRVTSGMVGRVSLLPG